ncbi:MAG TPA: LuxR C-terminal-related transcriptional regulator, partial [Mycobacterium sp.]|nr:LuxR C-terminal-related transcriptional regulator [Mycobacterium sp.]
LDQLTLLVDKSLVVAEDINGRTRYRLLETVRQYAAEKLGESGEADIVRTRHRDHYMSMASLVDTPARTGHQQRLEQVETEIDNLRTAFAWSRENSDFERALQLASSLQPLWHARGPLAEGLAWFDAVFAEEKTHHYEVAAAVRARALADAAELDALLAHPARMDQAQQALAIARELDDPALVARALTACGSIASYGAAPAGPYLSEAIGLARELGDGWRLSQLLFWQAFGAIIAGEPIPARTAADEGLDLADAIGDRLGSRRCRWCLGLAQWMQGDLTVAAAQLRDLLAEADAVHDLLVRRRCLPILAHIVAHRGETSAASAAANAALEDAAELGEYWEGRAYSALTVAALAAGDVTAATAAAEAAWQRISARPDTVEVIRHPMADVALAQGDLAAARRLADDVVSSAAGWHLASALTTRAHVAIAQGEPEQGERDAYNALTTAASTGAYQVIPDILECLAGLTSGTGGHREAARLFGAADSIRQRGGAVRLKIHDAAYDTSVAAVRDATGPEDFDAAWVEGAALSIDEAIAYAQRGRGERKRPTSGWASLTPTELDVVRLVSEGLTNKDIAMRLFVSPRTVQSHLTHIYTKLGLTSRVQLVQEAARHA